ncbi:hypothetical protein BIW11_08557 [Tropilaelaps mercedesae]|uniref:Uncharacterized protein n=1 Tax=Tropilaelaps mercedesae TaxID=418985 RepID=A0A1V9XNZ6_9ACAR|nr:hypothetical protein BIW11_08557 [Tropilaelaps mercedesae]
MATLVDLCDWSREPGVQTIDSSEVNSGYNFKSKITPCVSARKRGRVPFLPKCRRCGDGTLKGNQLMPCPSKKHTIHRLCINSKEGFPAKDCECPPDPTIPKAAKTTRKRKVKTQETAVVASETDGMSSSTTNYLSHLDATAASFFSTGMFYLQLPCPIFRSETGQRCGGPNSSGSACLSLEHSTNIRNAQCVANQSAFVKHLYIKAQPLKQDGYRTNAIDGYGAQEFQLDLSKAN